MEAETGKLVRRAHPLLHLLGTLRHHPGEPGLSRSTGRGGLPRLPSLTARPLSTVRKHAGEPRQDQGKNCLAEPSPLVIPARGRRSGCPL